MTDLDTGLHYPINLDTLPASWSVDYIGALAESIQSGFACGEHNSTANGTAHLRPMNISRAGRIDVSDLRFVPNEYDDRRLAEGDVLFNNTNSPELIGKTAYVGRDAAGLAFSNHMTRVRFAPVMDPRYAAIQIHYLWGMKYFLHRCVKHVNQASVSSTDLAKSVPLAIPPLHEQRRIVAKLEELFSELDKGVEALTTARQQLTAYRQAILKHAFEGKLTADWRLTNRACLRNANEIETFLEDARRFALEKNGRATNKPPTPFDRADLHECPTTWALVSTDSLCHHITSGSRDWSRFYNCGTSTFIMAQNVRPGRYDGSVNQHVDPPMENAETERTRVQIDDILVTIVGANTGDVCRFPLKSKTHFVCQSVAMMRLSCPEYARFVELYYQSRSGGQRQYTRYIYGAGRPHLSFEQLKKTVVPIPDPREAAEIVNAVDRIFSELDAAESMIDAELMRATSLRHALLKAAFSGQLVPQDPNDEPASVLLERIRAERENEAPVKRRANKYTKKNTA